ncbi:hypothetical protein B0O99DRAFT_745579 [Bisporella sp. PMI_857]|nr:hypothetical protein B0O99DRAFT_745579 [Bisporella sp. PMI_857]
MTRFKNYVAIFWLLYTLTNGDGIKAINPTGHQIGVNSITIVTQTNLVQISTQYLTGDPKFFSGKVGTDTEILAEHGGTLKWIGANTQYITEMVEISKVSGKPVTTTKSIGISIAGPLAVNGDAIGDLDVVLSPALVSELGNLGNTLCGVPLRGKRTCATDFASKAASLIGTFNAAKNGAATASGFTLLLIAVELQRLKNSGKEIPNKIHIPSSAVAQASPKTIFTTLTYSFTKTTQTTSSTTTKPTTSNLSGSSSIQTAGPDKIGGACWRYTGVESTPFDNDDQSEEKLPDRRRSIAGRTALFQPRLIKKETKKDTQNRIGKCNRTATQFIRSREHPKPGNVMKQVQLKSTGGGLPPDQWWFIPEQTPNQQGLGCHIASLAQKGKRDPTSPDTSKANFPAGYDQSSIIKQLTVDHVYEKKLISRFFESELTTPHDDRCEPFIALFDLVDPSFTGSVGYDAPRSRFASLWAQLPNTPDNNAFAGVDARINNLKAYIMEPGYKWPKYKRLLGNQVPDPEWDWKFQLWNNIGLVVDFMNTPAVIKLFAMVNVDIYRGLLAFDVIEQCATEHPNNLTLPYYRTNWALKYKKWIQNHLYAKNELIKKKVGEIQADIESHPEKMRTASGQPNEYATAFEQLKNSYSREKLNLKGFKLLEYPPYSSEIPLGIRDLNTNTCKASTRIECVKRTIVGCTYQYEDMPGVPANKCPPIPPLPASCSKPTISSKQNSIPKPTPTPHKPVSLNLEPQQCNPKSKHDEVISKDQEELSEFFCKAYAEDKIEPGNKRIWDPKKVSSGDPYHFSVSWIAGCRIFPGKQVQKVHQPLGGEGITCFELMKANYKKCANGGAGGYRDAGCLRYAFRATEKK